MKFMRIVNRIIPIVVLVIVVVFAFLFVKNPREEVKIFGNIKKVEGNTITVFGNYEKDAKDRKPLSDIKVEVNGSTKIIKTTFVKPPPLPNGEPFYVDKLPKETKEVDLATLAKDYKNAGQGVEVILLSSYFSSNNIAREIKYIGPKY